CLNDGTPEVRDASFSVLAAIAKTTKSYFPRKSAASMLSGKKPVQASGSLPINKKNGSTKSGASRKGEGGGQPKASGSVEHEDVEVSD
ncbi:hypothetical protein GIB67_017475, partial [Kingdonia uniflora]